MKRMRSPWPTGGESRRPVPLPGMDEPDEGTGVDPLSDLLVTWAGQGAAIIDHMARNAPHASPDAPPVEVVFRQIVRGVLDPLRERHSADHLRAAADVLLDAQRTLADEIFLVDLADVDTQD